MAQLEQIEITKKVGLTEERNVQIDSTSTEVLTPENFDTLLGDKKKTLQERANQISFLKRKIQFAESVVESEELTAFRKLLEEANALNEKDDNQRTLKILEMDHANIEREVLEYDNWLKSRGRTKASD